MGELVALSAFVKEVVAKKTEEKSYFNTTGKIILICEFDLEFRYDLRKAKISHQEGTVHIKLPEHYLKIVPKREHLFDEKKSSFLGVFGLDFSTELRNELSAVARETATQQAGILKEDLKEKVQASAISTLSALACGMGAKRVEVTFEGANTVVELPVVEQEKKAA